MLSVQRVTFRFLRIGCAPCLLLMVSCSLIAQSTAPAPAADTTAPAATCATLADSAIPLNSTIQAKVTGLMEANHLKPGKEFWISASVGMVFPGCTFDSGASIYGRVTAASSSKNPNASELALQFDKIDCHGHNKLPMKLFLIGVVAPPEGSGAMHDDVPTEVAGRGRQIDDTMNATATYDAKLNPGGPPHTIKPGAVAGFKNLKLEPQGGPECSARMSSANRNIELPAGTTLILAPFGASQ